MNDLIKRAMGAPKVNPFSFMALLASVGGIPGMDTPPVRQDRAFFKDTSSKINGFAAGHRYNRYDFFDLMEDQGLMPRVAEVADWLGDITEETIAHALGKPANDNLRRPRLVPSPQAA
jgi:hypothetical protein